MSRENLYPKVRAAREALREKGLEIYEKYMLLIDKAMADGEYETAEKSLRFLLEHMPAEDDGTRLVDPSVNKQKKSEKSSGPIVNIGFKIGGTTPKALPASIIEIEPSEN